MTEINEEVVTEPEAGEGEGVDKDETITIPKKDYDNLNQSIGSLKRENKDLKKPKEEPKKEGPKETPEKTKPDDNSLLEKAYLAARDITKEKEIELALKLSKDLSLPLDKLLDHKYFKGELETLRADDSNVKATSGVKGSGGTSQAKETLEYWKSKGTPPTPADIPDRKTRVKIVKAMMEDEKKGKTFYNE